MTPSPQEKNTCLKRQRKAGAIWDKRELTEEARRSRVYALGQETDAKRLALFGKASAALKAIRDDETFLRTFDVNAMQTACSIVTALDTDVTRDVLVSLIEPLRNSQQALASLRALCERRSIETSVFSEYMLCKYDEYKNGTPIPQEQYFEEAERYLQNYYCNHVGKVVPQTIVWIPTWIPRVDAQTLLNVLGQIAKVGGFRSDTDSAAA